MKRPLARIATLDGVKNVGRARRNALRSHNAAAAIGRGSGLAAIAQLQTCRTVVRLGMIERVVNCLFIIVPVGAICVGNYLIGRSWTRLDHNPWAGKFLGGTFSTPNPGWNPGALDLAKIHQRGRIAMTTAPVMFSAVVGVTFISFFTR